MKPIEIALIAGACILLLILKGIYDKYKSIAYMKNAVKNGYGQLPPNEYDQERYGQIQYYHENKEHLCDVIDEITWNDLDMEMVFMTINNTQSSMGEEYLYDMLHEPVYSKEVIEKRNDKIELFQENPKVRQDLGLRFKKIGKMRKLSVFQYVDLLLKAPNHNPWLDIVLAAGLLTMIGLSIFVSAEFLIGVVLFIVVNIVTYFRYQNRIYFSSFSQVAAMVNQMKDVGRMNVPELKEELDQLEKIAKPLHRMGRLSWLFKQGSEIGGTMSEVFMDYIKMIIHIDLILFDFVLASYKRRQNDLRKMMEIVGELDALIAVASYREYKGHWCVPVIETGNKPFIDAVDMAHPLLEKPVPATFTTNRCVLLTGSNASGKSTFLKAVALNAVLAQTIATAMAKSYKTSAFRVYSSMALKDNIMGNESYFIVEIKSLKRIMEKSGQTVPMLCFVDEVLRGTNTVERIAASSRILAKFAAKEQNTLCFAATHDIELTRILESIYDNYHFQEEINGQEVTFDYQLKTGRAVSRNAIKLLGMIGFESKVIEAAENAGKEFEETGIWQKIN